MSLDDQKTKYRALDDWFRTAQGFDIGQACAARLARLPDDCCGNALLQLGSGGENSWLPALNFRRQWMISPCLSVSSPAVVSSLNALPLNRNSVDGVLALFSMEALGWEKNPLDEIDRILAPMGHVIVVGINPFSLWGLALRLGLINCFGGQAATLISPLYLQQSLLRRGYRQRCFDSFYYLPPLRHEQWIKRLAFLNEMGKMVAPSPAGFYCLTMQKYQTCRPNLVRLATTRRNLTLAQEPAWASRTLL